MNFAASRGEIKDHGRDAYRYAPTGWPEVVAHLRLPQNVACGLARCAWQSTSTVHPYCRSRGGNGIQAQFPARQEKCSAGAKGAVRGQKPSAARKSRRTVLQL